jgi:hypothetical protein
MLTDVIGSVRSSADCEVGVWTVNNAVASSVAVGRGECESERMYR